MRNSLLQLATLNQLANLTDHEAVTMDGKRNKLLKRLDKQIEAPNQFDSILLRNQTEGQMTTPTFEALVQIDERLIRVRIDANNILDARQILEAQYGKDAVPGILSVQD